jgi:hypothetical protein
MDTAGQAIVYPAAEISQAINTEGTMLPELVIKCKWCIELVHLLTWIL